MWGRKVTTVTGGNILTQWHKDIFENPLLQCCVLCQYAVCIRELTHKCPIGDKMHNWPFQIGDWGLDIGDWGIGWNWLE